MGVLLISVCLVFFINFVVLSCGWYDYDSESGGGRRRNWELVAFKRMVWESEMHEYGLLTLLWLNELVLSKQLVAICCCRVDCRLGLLIHVFEQKGHILARRDDDALLFTVCSLSMFISWLGSHTKNVNAAVAGSG
nr:hypothetical protein [Tanacetum cinerariifolium]